MARATSSLARVVSSRVSASISSSTRARVSRRRSGCRRSTEMFVRTLVSGVRSSWPASWTSRRCASRDPPERARASPRTRRPGGDLVRPLRRHRNLQVARLSDLVGRPHEALEPPGQLAGEEPAGERGQPPTTSTATAMPAPSPRPGRSRRGCGPPARRPARGRAPTVSSRWCRPPCLPQDVRRRPIGPLPRPGPRRRPGSRARAGAGPAVPATSITCDENVVPPGGPSVAWAPGTSPARRPRSQVVRERRDVGQRPVDLRVEPVHGRGIAPGADRDGGGRGQGHERQDQPRPQAHGARTV